MAKAKPLSAKQLAVIDDLFEGELKEPQILEKHNISRTLYEKWLADEDFHCHLETRMVWEYRRSEIILVRSARQAVSNLMDLTKSKQAETARKACIDVITMRANFLSGTRAGLIDNPKPPPETPNFSPVTAGKLLAVLANDKGD